MKRNLTSIIDQASRSADSAHRADYYFVSGLPALIVGAFAAKGLDPESNFAKAYRMLQPREYPAFMALDPNYEEPKDDSDLPVPLGLDEYDEPPPSPEENSKADIRFNKLLAAIRNERNVRSIVAKALLTERAFEDLRGADDRQIIERAHEIFTRLIKHQLSYLTVPEENFERFWKLEPHQKLVNEHEERAKVSYVMALALATDDGDKPEPSL